MTYSRCCRFCPFYRRRGFWLSLWDLWWLIFWPLPSFKFKPNFRQECVVPRQVSIIFFLKKQQTLKSTNVLPKVFWRLSKISFSTVMSPKSLLLFPFLLLTPVLKVVFNCYAAGQVCCFAIFFYWLLSGQSVLNNIHRSKMRFCGCVRFIVFCLSTGSTPLPTVNNLKKNSTSFFNEPNQSQSDNQKLPQELLPNFRKAKPFSTSDIPGHYLQRSRLCGVPQFSTCRRELLPSPIPSL